MGIPLYCTGRQSFCLMLGFFFVFPRNKMALYKLCQHKSDHLGCYRASVHLIGCPASAGQLVGVMVVSLASLESVNIRFTTCP